jgi:hypothetical protein
MLMAAGSFVPFLVLPFGALMQRRERHRQAKQCSPYIFGVFALGFPLRKNDQTVSWLSVSQPQP